MMGGGEEGGAVARGRMGVETNPAGGGDLKQGINRCAHGSTRALTSSATALHYDQVLLHRHALLLQLHELQCVAGRHAPQRHKKRNRR